MRLTHLGVQGSRDFEIRRGQGNKQLGEEFIS